MATVFIVLLSIPCAWGQKQLRNVFVGDTVPNVKIENIKDADFSSMNLADFTKDKLLILDFWATWCAPCVYYLPKMDSIQREFGNRVQVVTVTRQSEKTVRDFFKLQEQREAHVSPLPKIFDDKALQELFPHNTVPHYVWIKDGKVVVISEEVTRKGVEAVLKGETVGTVTKTDFSKIEYDRYRTPLMDLIHGPILQQNKRKPFSYSLMTRFISELGYSGGYSSIQDSLGYSRITATNLNLLSLLKVAYGEMRTFISDAAIDINTTDSLVRKFNVSGMAAIPIVEKLSFCYEILTKDSLIFQKMRDDLKYAVPEITAKLVDAVDTCIVMEKINDKIYDFVSNNPVNESEYNNNGSCINNKNITMKSLRTTLEGFIFRYSKYPVVDETGFTKRFNLEICDYKPTIEGMNKVLEPYGLRLTKKLAGHKRLVIDKSP
ncbi:thiol-disulfide isomerase/thioredoxin [Sphingobacterium yanglingense]|uniref:Thiol-disulfide isomerase/thioredoxin n=2 Tax=Sphingobacterium yanglingense TaxID=1437280 RepID=A0A4R6WH08_9SPHI|nr:thiol-disulfide isomerase/thioredoxin [Sphingobacterium yanglingense]